MSDMAKASISTPEELLQELDDTIWELKREGHLDRDVDRSEVTRELWRYFLRQAGINAPPRNQDIARLLEQRLDEDAEQFGSLFEPDNGGHLGGF